MKALAAQAGEACRCPKCGAEAFVPGGREPPPRADSSANARADVQTPSPNRHPGETPTDQRSPRKPSSANPTGAAAGQSGPPDASARRTTDAIPALAPRPRPKLFVRCPLCRSPLAIHEHQVGTTVRCLDCHTEFEAQRKASETPRPKPSVADFEIALSDPVPTPRYQPSLADGVTAAELYGDLPVEGPPATSASVSRRPTNEPQLAVVCPLCRTRLYVTERQVGRQVRCGDCHTEFSVEAPRAETPRSTPHHDLDDVDFALEEVGERPKYRPLTRGSVTREQLDEIERARTSAAEPTEAAPRASRHAFDFEAICRHCGSRIPARDEQIGQKVVCGDCHSTVIVTRPRRRKAAAGSVAEAGKLPSVVGDSPAEAARDAPRESSIRWLNEAEREEEERAPEGRKLEGMPYFQQLVCFLADAGALLRIAVLSIALMLLMSIGTYIASFANAGLLAIVAVILVIVGMILLFPTLLGWANSMITIITDTGSGNAMIEDWSDLDIGEWLVQSAMVFFAFLVSAVPAAVFAGALSLVSASPWVSFGCLAVSVMLFLPPILISMLVTGSVFHVFAPEVWSTLSKAPGVWLRLYVTIGVLLVGLMGASMMVSSNSRLVDALGAICLVTLSFLYCRAIGIVADRTGSLSDEP